MRTTTNRIPSDLFRHSDDAMTIDDRGCDVTHDHYPLQMGITYRDGAAYEDGLPVHDLLASIERSAASEDRSLGY